MRSSGSRAFRRARGPWGSAASPRLQGFYFRQLGAREPHVKILGGFFKCPNASDIEVGLRFGAYALLPPYVCFEDASIYIYIYIYVCMYYIL